MALQPERCVNDAINKMIGDALSLRAAADPAPVDSGPLRSFVHYIVQAILEEIDQNAEVVTGAGAATGEGID